ncbi:hypothetical protein CMI42_01315 [Candidatus Pacearchaeota archaeon]|nr:hypothetical protein [Candidatus Pacearchaeota archaeon]
MESVDKLVIRNLKLFDNQRGNQIYLFLFRNWKTVTEVSEGIYPHLYEKGTKKKYKRRPHSAVSKYVKAFNELGWLESIEDKTDGRKVKYRATLKPYFQYVKEKKLTKQEIKIIEKYLDNWREIVDDFDENFIRAINALVKRQIYQQLSGLVGYETMNLRKDSKFPVAVRMAAKFYDPLNLQLLVDSLRSKAQGEGRHLKSEKKAAIIVDWIEYLDRKARGF